MESMRVSRRIRSIRLMEKLNKDKKLSKDIGISVKLVKKASSVRQKEGDL